MEPFAGVLVGLVLAEAGADVRIGITPTARPGRIKEPPIWVAEARQQSGTARSEKGTCLLRTGRGFCGVSQSTTRPGGIRALA
jgi:hypothetical protein